MDEDIKTEQKTQQVYSFGKRGVFKLHLVIISYKCPATHFEEL